MRYVQISFSLKRIISLLVLHMQVTILCTTSVRQVSKSLCHRVISRQRLQILFFFHPFPFAFNLFPLSPYSVNSTASASFFFRVSHSTQRRIVLVYGPFKRSRAKFSTRQGQEIKHIRIKCAT